MSTVLKDNKTDISTFIAMQMNCLYREFKLMQNQLSTGFNLMVPILITEMFKTLTHVYFVFAWEFCSLLLQIYVIWSNLFLWHGDPIDRDLIRNTASSSQYCWFRARMFEPLDQLGHSPKDAGGHQNLERKLNQLCPRVSNRLAHNSPVRIHFRFLTSRTIKYLMHVILRNQNLQWFVVTSYLAH